MDMTNVVHLVLGLVVALVGFLVRLSSRGMSERMDILEKKIAELTSLLDNDGKTHTP